MLLQLGLLENLAGVIQAIVPVRFRSLRQPVVLVLPTCSEAAGEAGMNPRMSPTGESCQNLLPVQPRKLGSPDRADKQVAMEIHK